MSKSRVKSRLSLSQRERMEVRDCSRIAFPAPTKWPGGRCRALSISDDSRSERRQFLVWPEILRVLDRVFHEAGIRGRNHPIRWRVSRWDNRNRGRKVRLDAAVGIYSLQSFDFEDGAKEHVHSRWRSCAGNGGESLGDCLTIATFSEKRNRAAPHLDPLPTAGRGECLEPVMRKTRFIGSYDALAPREISRAIYQ